MTWIILAASAYVLIAGLVAGLFWGVSDILNPYDSERTPLWPCLVWGVLWPALAFLSASCAIRDRRRARRGS